jgi:23S rRNA (cytosine1962-C5)-methyltransferase
MTTIAVPARGLDRLSRASDIPAMLCPVPAECEDGAVVTLVSARQTRLGVAVVDRETASVRVMIRGDESPGALDATWAAGRLAAAHAWRRAQRLTDAGQAYRLVNGAGDRVPGVLVDVYGDWAVVSALSHATRPIARLVADAVVETGIGRGAVVKFRGRGQAALGPGEVERVGESPPERLVVSEGPWRFEVHLTTGVNVGLFTDMRDERRRLAAMAAGRRVLNLFAYTGALSVATLSGGAASVTSVDLSEGALAWARDNVALNGLDPARHVTLASDAARFVAEARTRGDRYDLVLVDPPSYSAARGAAFSIERDYPALLDGLVELVGTGGALFAVTNTRGFSLTGALCHAVATQGRQAVVAAVGGLPVDYPTELADVEARYLQSCLVRLL